MPVPNIFGTATAAIPLSQLDTNFATPVTIGNTAVQLGNTVTSFGNVTLTNVTISSGNVIVTGANVSGTANVSTLVVTSNETVLGNTAVTGNITASLFTSTSTFGFKNRIINGAMVIDQRNAGASVSNSSSGTPSYTLDRWGTVASQASKFTIQQNAGSVTPPAGFTNYLGVTSSSAYSRLSTDYFGIVQPIEGFNASDLNFGSASAKTITLNFWVRSSLTGTFAGRLTNSASNRSYVFTYSISSASTWEQKSITITGDATGTWLTTNGIGISIWFDLGTGSNFQTTAGAWTAGNYAATSSSTSVVGTNGATFYITGVQLEVGSTATSFDYRPYGTEMSLCQRYYWRTGGSQFGGAFMPMVLFTGISTTSLAATIQLPVRGRTPPTSITLGGSAPSISGGTISTNLTLDRNSYDSVMVYILGTGFAAGTSYRWIGNPDATTFLGFEGMEL